MDAAEPQVQPPQSSTGAKSHSRWLIRCLLPGRRSKPGKSTSAVSPANTSDAPESACSGAATKASVAQEAGLAVSEAATPAAALALAAPEAKAVWPERRHSPLPLEQAGPRVAADARNVRSELCVSRDGRSPSDLESTTLPAHLETAARSTRDGDFSERLSRRPLSKSFQRPPQQHQQQPPRSPQPPQPPSSATGSGSASNSSRNVDTPAATAQRAAPPRVRIPMNRSPAPIDEASVSITVAPSMSDIPTWQPGYGSQPVPQELLGDSDSRHEYLSNVEHLPPLPVWNPEWPPTAEAADCGVAADVRRGVRPTSMTPGAPELRPRPRSFRRPKNCSSETATAMALVHHGKQEDREEAVATKGYCGRAVSQGSACAGTGSRTSTAAPSTSGRRTASSLSNGFAEGGGQRLSPVRGTNLLPRSPMLAAAETAATPEALLPYQQSSYQQQELLPQDDDDDPHQSCSGAAAARPSGQPFDSSSSVAPRGVDRFDVRRSNARASRASAVAPPPLPERLMTRPSSLPEADGRPVQVSRVVPDENDSIIRNTSEQKAVDVKHHKPSGLNNDKFSELARAFALLDDIT